MSARGGMLKNNLYLVPTQSLNVVLADKSPYVVLKINKSCINKCHVITIIKKKNWIKFYMMHECKCKYSYQ